MSKKIYRAFFLCISILLLTQMILSSCTKSTQEGMVLIPAGEFDMGLSEDLENDKFVIYGFNKPLYADATPLHKVSVGAFYIDQFEVSNRDYAEFVQKTGYAPPPVWMGNKTYQQGSENLPVVSVDWKDASEYCKWKGKRLPTEQEWEKAARGGDGRFYPWGNEFDYEKANVSKDPFEPGHVNNVNGFKTGVTPSGIYNLTGNVWEWVADWYEPYPNSEYIFPEFREKMKVLRGNSFSPMAHYKDERYDDIVRQFSKATYRHYASPSIKTTDIGFRCAK